MQRGRERVLIDHDLRYVYHDRDAAPALSIAATFVGFDTAIMPSMSALVQWGAVAKTGQRVYHFPLSGADGLAHVHMVYDVAKARFVSTRLEAEREGDASVALAELGLSPGDGVRAVRVDYDVAPAPAPPKADPSAYVRDGRGVGACAGYTVVAL